MENDQNETLLELARNRARRWEPHIDAWASLPDGPAPQATCLSVDRPLAGIPFAVKDVIDTAGFPTRYGSDAFGDAPPAKQDAPVVAALRQAGAIPVGKTRSTEFAFIDPTITRNPYDPTRSPGGSSSGSGAVVGAGIVPFALGTQTAGSLCRPATYCGAASYKPGYGVLPVTGMAPLSRQFDTIGVIAESATWLGRIFSVLAKDFGIPVGTVPAKSLRIGLLTVPEQAPEPSMRHAMQDVVSRLRTAGHKVTETKSPISFASAIAHHRTIMLAQAALALIPLVGGRRDRLKPKLAAALQEGAEIKASDLDRAILWIKSAQKDFWKELAAFDLLLAYPVPGAAPIGLATTGDQTYLTPWTAMAGPLVSLPIGIDPEGLPLGILLGAPPGQDSFLLEAALVLAALLPDTPSPPLPETGNLS